MNLWNNEQPICEITSLDVPDWINADISPSDVAAICQGGCASGAYMPAVRYHDAALTMADHGDDVLDYIANTLGELPNPPQDTSWSGLACFYLSAAVELWASGIESELESMDEPNESDAA